VAPENYSVGKESLWLVRCSGVAIKIFVIVLAEDLSIEGG
jgi:hypothetical protein